MPELDASFDDASPVTEPTEEATEVVEDSLGNQFLSKIPEQDRPIVGKYVKDWDGNVTRKFQELQGQLKPYKELGNLEEIQKARQFYNVWQTNGEQVFGNLLKGFFQHYGDDAYNRLNAMLGIEAAQMAEEQQEWEYETEEEDPRDIQLQNMQQELEEFRAWREQQESYVEEQQASAQLDDMLAGMHNVRADIPEKFILQGIAAGSNPEQIIAFYDELAANRGSQNTPRNTPPPVMGGQGGVPSGQVDVSKLDRKGRTALVAQFLEAAGQ